MSDFATNMPYYRIKQGLRITCANVAIALEKRGDRSRARELYLLACRRGDVLLDNGNACDAAERLGGKPDRALARRVQAEDDEAFRDGKELDRQRLEQIEEDRQQAAEDRQERQQMMQATAAGLQAAMNTATMTTPRPMSVPVARPPQNSSVSRAPASARTMPSASVGTGTAPRYSPTTVANNAGANCTNMNGAVTFTATHPTGPGHCAAEVVGRITNRSAMRLYCRVTYFSGGQAKHDTGAFDIAPGQTMGGEGSGLWSCSADEIKYSCVPSGATAASCAVNW